MYSKYCKLLFLLKWNIFVDINFIESERTISKFSVFNIILESLQIVYITIFIEHHIHIFSPKNENSVPLGYSDIASDLEDLEICIKSYRLLSFCFKVSFRKSGDRFLLTRSISIVRFWMLLIWIETEKSFSSSSVNDNCLSW